MEADKSERTPLWFPVKPFFKLLRATALALLRRWEALSRSGRRPRRPMRV
ncbi:hypothetical protein FHS43_000792 [Streptosporangium becharense]|uniref:Uncharacterized protein n=1 Tax=Streptosporangium becharense TaxID=1816182 RepID=A0A7W9IEY8_9ACTN|nr:hypothetical protein [Streptosporangium becharense]MBB2909546.1 hypothetical protein [Streptosporangium becharense]MBB5819497.1 hypothetical protein [Streptosporangium becharense]